MSVRPICPQDYTRKKKSKMADPSLLEAVLAKHRETHFAGSVEVGVVGAVGTGERVWYVWVCVVLGSRLDGGEW